MAGGAVGTNVGKDSDLTGGGGAVLTGLICKSCLGRTVIPGMAVDSTLSSLARPRVTLGEASDGSRGFL